MHIWFPLPLLLFYKMHLIELTPGGISLHTSFCTNVPELPKNVKLIRSLGAPWAPTSSLRPFLSLLDFLLRPLQAFRPCDP